MNGFCAHYAFSHSSAECTQRDFSFLEEDFIGCSVSEVFFGPVVYLIDYLLKFF